MDFVYFRGFQVWSHFRFVLRDNIFHAALGDTQVLRTGTADKNGTAESTSWLLRAGQAALALGVQVGGVLVSCITVVELGMTIV